MSVRAGSERICSLLPRDLQVPRITIFRSHTLVPHYLGAYSLMMNSSESDCSGRVSRHKPIERTPVYALSEFRVQ